ncbi:MAG: 2-amino-4-hydroxy-6-hydroxymethyldihydropteridine diphosphokinase, partial [Actinomycetota bacterium]|nr:2-amino-4-hydroxy-6-hydroxymethyldihydropteridine diphosphokinase [Actinomycetota bacterium]
PIDLDVLLLGDIEQVSQRLTLPHPEVTSRRFVLQPLLELDPDLRLPAGRELSGFLAAVSNQRATPHAGVSWR